MNIIDFFINKNIKEKLKLKEEAYNSMEKQCLKYRRDYLELLDKTDIDRVEELEDTIAELTKNYNTNAELLAEYHLRFGDDTLQMFKAKRGRIGKREKIDYSEFKFDVEEVEL